MGIPVVNGLQEDNSYITQTRGKQTILYMHMYHVNVRLKRNLNAKNDKSKP